MRRIGFSPWLDATSLGRDMASGNACVSGRSKANRPHDAAWHPRHRPVERARRGVRAGAGAGVGTLGGPGAMRPLPVGTLAISGGDRTWAAGLRGTAPMGADAPRAGGAVDARRHGAGRHPRRSRAALVAESAA